MSDRKRYPHFWAPDAPRIIQETVQIFGTREIVGKQHNPVILGWATEVEEALGIRLNYNADEIPWCGLSMAVVALRAGWKDEIPDKPLWARNWTSFGQPAPVPMFGDILVFRRPGGGGHVGPYVAEDSRRYYVGGGNQSNSINIAPLLKDRLIEARRPKWRVAQPASVRRYFVTASGPLSTNEA
jgi:uncharacterized protein (TIGR02594 family)